MENKTEENWDAETKAREWLLKNSHRTLSQSDLFNTSAIRYYCEDEFIPIEELEACVVKAARIVRTLGVEYIEVFERAERELQDAKRTMQTLKRIDQLTSKNRNELNFKGNLAEPGSLLFKAWSKAVTGSLILVPH